MKNYVYGLIILSLSLVHFMAMGRTARPAQRALTFKPTQHQNFMSRVAQNHPSYAHLNTINASIAELKESEVCRSGSQQCADIGQNVVDVFEVLKSSDRSVGTHQVAGAIASRAAEIVDWEASARKGAIVFFKSFVGQSTGTSVSARTNNAVEALLRHQNVPAVLSDAQRDRAVRLKRKELRESCRYI